MGRWIMINFEDLNNVLADVELIISSSYNFRFPDLTADDVGTSNVMISILQTRVITEGICRFVVLQEHIVKDEKSIRTATLKVYVDDLLGPNLIVPKTIISNLKTIQGISNLVVHFQVDGHVDKKDAYICLESLEQVLSWFKKSYSGIVVRESQWKISSDMLNKSGLIPQRSPDCIIQRNDDVMQIRNILLKDRRVLLNGYSGVGKTELAKEYVGKYKKKYDGVYYAENVGEVDDYIFNMPIGILDEHIKTKEEIIKEKLDVIHAMGLTYLFIIDNYTGKESELRCLYPDRDDEYHLMILVNEDNEIEWNRSCFEVQVFTREESHQIFHHFCERQIEESEVDILLEHIKYNPRAIKMCATFLQENDLFTIPDLLNGVSNADSVKDVMKNLYMVLSELSILENDSDIRKIAECLSLLPYNGVSKNRFTELFTGINEYGINDQQVEENLRKLSDKGWIQIDEAGYISISPLLSDTVFEKIQPNLSTSSFKDFITPILKPIKEIRNLYLSQIVALKPFVDLLTKRVIDSTDVDWDIINELREYYIAVYDLEKVKILTDIMESEFAKYNQRFKPDFVENAIYRQGISRFNLEDFSEAHKYFDRALEMLEKKKLIIQKDIARISAYEGASLSSIGEGEKAVELVKRSVYIRESLAASGDMDEEKKLWISHYNYAKVLMQERAFEMALDECNIAIEVFKQSCPDEYQEKESTNVSSLLQLKGRILCGLGVKEQALHLLEEAKRIRENKKGKSHFSSGQVYSYLMDAYAQFGDYGKALEYAVQYYNVLSLQYKTEDIMSKMTSVEKKMNAYKECME